MSQIWTSDKICCACKKNKVDNGWNTCDKCIDKFTD